MIDIWCFHLTGGLCPQRNLLKTRLDYLELALKRHKKKRSNRLGSLLIGLWCGGTTQMGPKTDPPNFIIDDVAVLDTCPAWIRGLLVWFSSTLYYLTSRKARALGLTGFFLASHRSRQPKKLFLWRWARKFLELMWSIDVTKASFTPVNTNPPPK